MGPKATIEIKQRGSSVNARNIMQRTGATPGKLALVAVLAVVLVGVIVMQLPDRTAPALAGRSTQTPSRSDPTSRRPAQVKATDSASSSQSDPNTDRLKTTEQTVPRNWPDFPMATIVAHDPLAAPEWVIAAQQHGVSARDMEPNAIAKSKRNADALSMLRKQGAKVVVISGSEKRASIGEQSVRIGETIEGFRIIDITKQGVVLTELGRPLLPPSRNP